MSCEHGEKYADEITHYLWNLTLDSEQDDTCGDSEGIGWHARFDGSIIGASETISSIAGSGMSADFDMLTVSDIVAMATCAGAIIWEDSQGFVSSNLYSDAIELASSWREVEEEEAAYDSEPCDDA